MKRAIIPAVAGLLALAAPTFAHHRPSHTGGPGDSSALTAAANPFVLTFGASTVVSGRLTGANNAGQRVTLAEDPFPYDGAFTDVSTTTTANSGNYAFPRLVPASNRNYRVTVRGEQTFTGARVRLRVSLGLSDFTPVRGQRVRFSGFVSPKHDGRTVIIQRRTSTGTWAFVRRTLLRATTGNRSRYSTVLRVFRSGSYRARSGTDGDHLTGTSTTRTARVG
ncbi:MAG TPA: hypothetical protein VNB64_01480 [Solirubrobacteraceae bacterium]|nr:hypothetical protein [Solirubrobacteraceae bacterium]